MAFTRFAVIALIFALFTIPLGYLEVAFGFRAANVRTKFSNLKIWFQSVWEWYVTKSRFSFIFGAVIFVLSPVIWVVLSGFSLLFQIGQLLREYQVGQIYLKESANNDTSYQRFQNLFIRKRRQGFYGKALAPRAGPASLSPQVLEVFVDPDTDDDEPIGLAGAEQAKEQ